MLGFQPQNLPLLGIASERWRRLLWERQQKQGHKKGAKDAALFALIWIGVIFLGRFLHYLGSE